MTDQQEQTKYFERGPGHPVQQAAPNCHGTMGIVNGDRGYPR